MSYILDALKKADAEREREGVPSLHTQHGHATNASDRGGQGPVSAAVGLQWAVGGVAAAHAMFAEPLLQVSARLRDGPAQAFSEGVATFGLLATILGTVRFRPDITAVAVGLYITAAYWFTASTSFANPAVTIARSLTDTFAGIAPTSAPAFIGAQLAGAALAALAFGWLLRGERAA